MDSKKRSLSLTVTLGLIALNLVAFNYLIAGWTTARVDLTEEGLYSISPATRRLLGSLDDELTIYGYFSKRTHPKLSPLVPEIVDLLDEYRAISRDRVYVELIDPGENEAAEQEAADRFGVQSTPFRLASKYESGIVNAYFALVIRYGDQYVRYGFDDLIEIEPTPDGDIDVRLRNLEYDLTRAIKKVVYGFRSTAELFERIEEPVRLTVIMTPDAMPELFQDVPQAVRLAAEELKEAGGDKFTYEEFDPSDDEQQQDDLMRLYGARPMSLGLFGDESFYLYGFLETGRRLEQLVLTAEEVTAATIREAIESSLRRLTPGFLKTVGVVAPTPSIPPEVMMQLQMQGRMPPQPPPEFEQVKRVLSQDYQVRDVNLDAAVPVEIDTLLVLKPTDLAERDVYHLDQYLMRGGRVIVCVGNYETQFDPSGLRVAPVTTGLDGWLEHFGVEVPRTLVLDDRNQPLPVPELRRTPLGTLRTWRMAPYPYLVEVREDGLAERSITARLDAVGVYWASPITLDEDKSKELEVLPVLRSSASSWTDDDTSKVSSVDYQVPAEGTKPQLLAVALNGRFESYFAGKQPPAAEGTGDADGPGEPPAEVPLEVSPETRLVVIGNAEFLSDFVARALGRTEGGFFDANLGFAQNLIDWMNLDSDLLAIRARGGAARQLDRLERSTEVTVELSNYLAPLLALFGFGAYRLWRRRHVAPVVGRRAASMPAVPKTSGHGAGREG